MDHIINIAKTISKKLSLCENAYANTKLIELSKLLIQEPELNQNKNILLLLNKMITAHENKNYVYLADILEYELIPALSAPRST